MFSTLLVDIGGVLLTDGWNTASRQEAARIFGLDWEEMQRLHHQANGAWELGKISQDDYLRWVIFSRQRSFSRDDFVGFMCAQSQPHQDVINYVRDLKQRHGWRVVAVSNESAELSQYRIRQFGLREVADSFVVSGWVHYGKPDPDIFRLATNVAAAAPEECLYLENSPMFVQVAQEMGITAILHEELGQTRRALSDLGLE